MNVGGQVHAFPFDLELHRCLGEYPLGSGSGGNRLHFHRCSGDNYIQFLKLFLNSLGQILVF